MEKHSVSRASFITRSYETAIGQEATNLLCKLYKEKKMEKIFVLES